MADGCPSTARKGTPVKGSMRSLLRPLVSKVPLTKSRGSPTTGEWPSTHTPPKALAEPPCGWPLAVGPWPASPPPPPPPAWQACHDHVAHPSQANSKALRALMYPPHAGFARPCCAPRRERGDPKEMLRAINPREAQLADAASGIHVRFRLGGTMFPPLVFYKIFTHRCTHGPTSYQLHRSLPANRPPPCDT